MQVKQERTRWRDEGLSAKHREWGWDCPAIDIDFLLLEYDSGKPIALVEYKSEYALVFKRNHPSCVAITFLADSAEIPFFLVQYTEDYTVFTVTPLNYYAQQHFTKKTKLTEYQWVKFLYKLRNRQLPVQLETQLTNMTFLIDTSETIPFL